MESLARALRDRTKVLHTEAERTGAMQALLRGDLALPTYRELLRNLHAVYAAMEPALRRHAGEASIAPLFDATLFRADALAADLRVLGDSSADSALPLRPATLAYVRRLREIDAGAPGLLAAHAYVRYLGDLSGGQILARVVTRAYGLAPGRGTRFYDFGAPDQVAAKVEAFRRGLDALPCDAAGASTIVDEACWAFERHTELFTQLAVPAGC